MQEHLQTFSMLRGTIVQARPVAGAAGLGERLALNRDSKGSQQLAGP